MFGNTLTIFGKTLSLINQDGYASEYFLSEAAEVWRVKIRHSRDKVRAGEQPYDRHAFTLFHEFKPSATYPTGSKTEITFSIRNDPNGVSTTVRDLSQGVVAWMDISTGHPERLGQWES